MTLLLIYVGVALGISFLCSVMEAVLLSVTPAFVERFQQKQARLGQRLQQMKADVDRPLAAILSLNTIAHTIGAAGAGAQAARVFGDAYVGVISGVLTFLILVISEIIPKTLGAVYWRQLTPWVIHLLIPIIWLMWPLVKMAQGLTRLMAPDYRRHAISRDEFLALADLGLREGIMKSQDSKVLKNLFKLGEIRAGDIMTPRNVIFALPESMTVQDFVKENRTPQFSRIPVFDDSVDHIHGYVLSQEVLLAAAKDEHHVTLKDLTRQIPVLTTETALATLLEHFLSHRCHIVLLVDDYGGTDGIVTMEDLMETLLGLEIVDERDRITDMREYARQSWLERAKKRGISLPGKRKPQDFGSL